MNDITPDIGSKVARSAAYPAISIEDAIGFVAQIKKSFPNSSFKREDISHVLKKAAIHREIAAAVQYGLVERKDDSYKLSSRVQEIINYVDEDEKRKGIVDCFNSPKLYLELIERFKGHVIPPDPQLRAILQRFHNITEAAAPQAANVFIENGLYASVINENRILFGETSIKDNSENILQVEAPADQAENEPTTKRSSTSQAQNSNNATPLLLEEMNGSINLKILLTEKKKAHLVYPESLNEKDIQILRLQLDALELTL